MSADLRQGVTPAQHAILDRAAELVADDLGLIEYYLRLAERAAAAARRADPATGNGLRRVKQAHEAAALLLAAIARMSLDGRDMKPW
jgi:hypothetical protein